MVADLWNKLRVCFEADDGSLPGIEIANLTGPQVGNIYRMLRQRSVMVTPNAEFWSETKQTSEPVDSVANPALLVAQGGAAPFHHCVGGIQVGDVVLPDLGLFVFKDMIELDYRMGADWGQEQVSALFQLLFEICEMAPQAVVPPAESEGPPFPDRFSTAWGEYRREKKSGRPVSFSK